MIENRFHLLMSVIDHSRQRYNTSGDWIIGSVDPGGGFKPHQIIGSDLGDPRYNHMLLMHEAAELMWCLAHGVTQEQVDAFDMAWYPHDGIEEPGDDPKAPYYEGHQLGCAVERILSLGLRVNWKAYEDAYDALPEWTPP